MLTFDQEIAAALEKATNSQRNNKSSHLNKSNYKIYLIGKNDESYEFANRYIVDGLIDDHSQTEGRWSGLPITKTSDVPKDSIIINCVTSISPVQVTRKLKSAGLKNVVEVAELISEDGEILPLP
jgi:hypothetical protein